MFFKKVKSNFFYSSVNNINFSVPFQGHAISNVSCLCLKSFFQACSSSQTETKNKINKQNNNLLKKSNVAV